VAKHGRTHHPVYEEKLVTDGTAIIETDPTIEAEIASRQEIDAAIGAREGDLIVPTGIISEQVVKEEKKKKKEHHPKKSRAELEAEVNYARDDLGTTLDELVSKVYDLTPKNQANKLKKTARHMALQTLADVKGFFAGEGMPADPERRKMVERVLKAAGGVAGLVALRVALRSLHNHHTKATIKKAAKKAAKEAAKHSAEHQEHRGGKGHGRSKHRSAEPEERHGGGDHAKGHRRKRDLISDAATTIVELIDPVIEVDGTYYEK